MWELTLSQNFPQKKWFILIFYLITWFAHLLNNYYRCTSWFWLFQIKVSRSVSNKNFILRPITWAHSISILSWYYLANCYSSISISYRFCWHSFSLFMFKNSSAWLSESCTYSFFAINVFSCMSRVFIVSAILFSNSEISPILNSLIKSKDDNWDDV